MSSKFHYTKGSIHGRQCLRNLFPTSHCSPNYQMRVVSGLAFKSIRTVLFKTNSLYTISFIVLIEISLYGPRFPLFSQRFLCCHNTSICGSNIRPDVQIYITMREQGSEGSLQIASLHPNFWLDSKWPCKRMPPEMLSAGSNWQSDLHCGVWL